MNATSLTTRASSDAPSFFDSVFFFVLGASFHVLATPEIGGVSVRLGVSDLLLGAALLLLAWRYIGPSKIPPPAAPLASYVWHAGMLTLFVWAYLPVLLDGDSSAQWARIKVVGFVVLFAYFVLGSWIASTSTRSGLLVARGFVAGAWVTAAVGVVEYGAAHYLVYPIPWYPRPAALAGNPNAFGIMLGAALALELGSRATRPLFSTRVATLGASVILVAIFVSA